MSVNKIYLFLFIYSQFKSTYIQYETWIKHRQSLNLPSGEVNKMNLLKTFLVVLIKTEFMMASKLVAI